MKIKITLLSLAALIIAGFSAYLFLTRDFEAPLETLDSNIIPLPDRVYAWSKKPLRDELQIYAYLQDFIEKDTDVSKFPCTRQGLLKLETFFLILAALQEGSIKSDGVHVNPDCPLYRRLSLFFPTVDRDSEIKLSRISEQIAGQQPSRFRYFLYKIGLMKE